MKPSLSAFALALGVAFLAISSPASAETETKRPNILFILADDLGCMDIGAIMPQPNPKFDADAKSTDNAPQPAH